MKGKLTKVVFLVAMMFSVLNSVNVSAPPKLGDPPTIEYVTHYINPDLTVTFEYRLTSGDSPVLKQWELYSSCFTSRKIIKVSEQYSVNPSKRYIRFDTKYDPDESRIVEITLQLDYYSMMIDDIDYVLRWPPGTEVEGIVLGPVCPPDMVIPEGPLGTLGVLIPITTAIGLVYAFRKNVHIV